MGIGLGGWWRNGVTWKPLRRWTTTIYIATLTTQALHTWTRAHVGKVSRVRAVVCVWRSVAQRHHHSVAVERSCWSHEGHGDVETRKRRDLQKGKLENFLQPPRSIHPYKCGMDVRSKSDKTVEVYSS